MMIVWVYVRVRGIGAWRKGAVGTGRPSCWWVGPASCDPPMVHTCIITHSLTPASRRWWRGRRGRDEPKSAARLIYTYTYIHTYIHTYIYIHTYKHIYTYIHIKVDRELSTYPGEPQMVARPSGTRRWARPKSASLMCTSSSGVCRRMFSGCVWFHGWLGD